MKVWNNMDIIVGRMAMGVGTLNPACAIELRAEA